MSPRFGVRCGWRVVFLCQTAWTPEEQRKIPTAASSIRALHSLHLSFLLDHLSSSREQSQSHIVSVEVGTLSNGGGTALPQVQGEGPEEPLVPWILNIWSPTSLFYQVTSYPGLSLMDRWSGSGSVLVKNRKEKSTTQSPISHRGPSSQVTA